MFYGAIEGTGFEVLDPRFNECLTGHGRVERLWTGSGVQMGKNVKFHGRNVVGNGAEIGDGATLTDCILWDGATVKAGETLTRAIVTPTERLTE